MENIELKIAYVTWILIIGLVITFFSFLSKQRNYFILMTYVLFPTWIIITILKGLEYKYLYNSDKLFSLIGLRNLMVEKIPDLLLFGALTFFICHINYCKKQEKKK